MLKRYNSRKIAVLILLALPVGDIGLHSQQLILHQLHSLIRRHWQDID